MVLCVKVIKKMEKPISLNKAKESLIEKVRSYNPDADFDKINQAFDLAEKAHVGQLRASGEPFIFHPIAVAEILTEIKLDTSSIITALLHDTIEDSNIPKEYLAEKFGNEIANLVDGVTKLTKIKYQPEHVKQAENFRKFLLAISEDIRVLIVKLADRLHNMRTLIYTPTNSRAQKAYETMEIYAPLAERMGIYKFKNELQELAFAELHPDIRKSIVTRLNFLKNQGVSLVQTIEKEIKDTLKSNDVEATVQGREKTPCSIWRKMENKNIGFDQLSDIMAFRIIVNDIMECYKVLGIIHSKYHTVPGEFKDFISTPKNNGYQSIHTVVMGPEKRCIEVQIRTTQMHEVAELGFAAHWAYKQECDYSTVGTQFRWVRELLNILDKTSSPEEFLENTKLEMYYDQVFCFTPKGDLIALPRGATPVDFAFAVHSKVGLSCIGAKINGRIVPLKTKLENGDQVEIIRSKTPMPSATWEKFAVTGKARAEIRKFIRSKQQDQYIQLGKSILDKTFEQYGKKMNDSKLKKALKAFSKDDIDDLLADVGKGVINRNEVLHVLFPELGISDGEEVKKKTKSKNKKQNIIPIKGLIPGIAVHYGSCCNPMPNDKIVGIVNTGHGITIHTTDCHMLDNYTEFNNKWVDVDWEEDSEQKYVGKIKIIIINESGSLAAVTNQIAENHLNINNVKILSRSDDFFEVLIEVEVHNTKELHKLITSLKMLSSIHSVERAKL